MRALINRQSIIIASTAVIIALITFISLNAFGIVGPVTNAGNAITSPIRTLASNVTRIFERIYSSIYRYDALMAEYERIVEENSEFRQNFIESQRLAEENEILRAQLGFRRRNPDFESEYARLTTWSGSNWSSSFTINRGYANSNVTSGNAVVTEYGVLIGQITDVGATTSTVVTVLDTTFSAGAFVGEGGGTGTLRGDFSLMRNGLIMLDQIDDEQIVRIGDQIITSGRGGIFPPWLTVGDVVGLYTHPTGIGRYATVRPSRVLEALNEVFVITDFEPVTE